MNIIINGEKTMISPGSTIEKALKEYDFAGSYVIEINGEIIDSNNYDAHLLKENDTMEIIRFVGGG
jgi:sulfur carrier protein